MVRLECAASGHPTPQLGWQKDGRTDFPAVHVMPTDDVFFIVNVNSVDSGVYSCTAKDIAGVIIANATLTVVVYDSSVNEEDVTGVIIITVVCCAVGTPIVWVIIIYQICKRLNTQSPPAQTKTYHLDNKTEHSSSSKDSGPGDSTKRSHEDLLLETIICVHQESEQTAGPEVTAAVD